MKTSLFTILSVTIIFIACSNSVSDDNSESVETVFNESNSSIFYSSSHKISSSSSPETSSSNLNDLILVSPRNQEIIIGEKIKTVLNYDFYMAATEVTCGEYGEATCQNDSLPVVNVTYFDAILYANKKSKAEKLDTVYTYSKASFDSKKHCTQLENLSFQNEKFGYRLPTEAEWIAAASKAWDAQNSWNSANSDNTVHRVCSKGKDNAGFCDFAGNVMEWVNDWFIPATDTTLTNFIGGSTANGLGERILKGGSYVNDIQAINLYSQSDVYTVTSSTNANYVGFRLAIGKIPDPNTLSDKPVPVGIPTIFLANGDAIKSITGTYSTKLVFRNDVTGNLAYVDYSDITLPLFEIQDTLNAFHPDISPNGVWVAFSTSIEGVSQKSALYVRKLNPTGSNLVKLDVESAAIPRWSIKDNGDTVIIYVTDSGNNKDDADWMQKSTWEVPFANGTFGIPQKLFDGSYHGGIDENATLAVSGARLLRARIAAENGSIYDANAKDTIWYNGEQACNASLVKDGTGRTAFLDFGGKTGRTFVGQQYATHQRILIADKKGNLIQSIGATSGYTFDHTEWASNGETSNIIATLTDAEGEHRYIALVNVKDSTILPIVQGEELWHPCMWVAPAFHKPPTTDTISDTTSEAFPLDPDSAGIYFQFGAAGTETAVKWRYKMELLWKYRNSINTIIMGSSRALHGVIPTELSDKFWAVNFANSNGTLFCTNFFLNNYALPHIKNLKYIIMSIDIDRGFNTEANSFFLVNRQNFPGYIYDENHNFWKEGVPEELVQRTYESVGYYKFENYRETRGYEQLEANGWDEPKIWTDSMWMNTRANLYYANFNLLKEILVETGKRDIKVIGVIFPQNPAYANTGSFSFHGIQRSKAPALIQELDDLSKTYPNFTLMDENKMGYHEYTDEMAFDNNHLAHPGAIYFTSKLDSLLSKLSIQDKH